MDDSERQCIDTRQLADLPAVQRLTRIGIDVASGDYDYFPQLAQIIAVDHFADDRMNAEAQRTWDKLTG